MSRVPALALLTSSLSLGACGGETTEPLQHLPRPLSASEQALVEANASFAFALFREALAGVEPKANVFVSPLSVGMALGMTLNGAAGGTEPAIRSALGVEAMSRDEVNRGFRDLIALLVGLDAGVDVGIANSLWVRLGVPFEPDFLDVNRSHFDARVEALDFAAPAAAGTINAWVNEETEGRIPTIVPDGLLPETAVMYVLNATYFRGAWTEPFDAALTKATPFALAGGDTVDVATMTHGGMVRVRSGRRNGADVLELPYARGAFSMVVIAPDDPADLETLVGGLTPATWADWLGALQEGDTEVYLPKLSFAFEASLNEALETLGMGIAFSGAADFTRARATGELAISEVRHKAFVEVDEEGTAAAAATVVSFFESGPPQVRVNRPFLLVMRERFSGTVMYLGRVMDPR